jgi:hypothetical protein
VDNGAAAALSRGYFVRQVGEVGGEDGGKQLDHSVLRGKGRSTQQMPD